MYVSITGLTVVKGQKLRFTWHALRSLAQARRASGNLHTAIRRIEGVEHTLTVWIDRHAMLDYLKIGAHLSAMKAFRRIGHGRLIGYEADVIPSWEEALDRWHREAREI